MNNLSQVYRGDNIYVPEKLRVFIEPWLHQKATAKLGKGSSFQSTGGGFQSSSPDKSDCYRWEGKTIIFFCEDELVIAYKGMPVPHMPEKIMEEAFIIEFTLEDQTAAVRSSKPWHHGGAKKVERTNKKGGKLW
jgi:hypothetical protein